MRHNIVESKYSFYLLIDKYVVDYLCLIVNKDIVYSTYTDLKKYQNTFKYNI